MKNEELSFDPKADKIIKAVLDGDMSPLEGATNLSAHWFPIESTQNIKLPITIQTRQFEHVRSYRYKFM